MTKAPSAEPAATLLRNPLFPPSPDEIRAMREAAELTQGQAAHLVHLSGQARWSDYEADRTLQRARRIDLAHWELFLRKIAEIERAREVLAEIGEAAAPRERARRGPAAE